MEKTKVVVVFALVGLMLGHAGVRMPLEMLFPGHCFYFVITFFLTYQNCGYLRHLLVTILLSFGDLIFLGVVGGRFGYTRVVTVFDREVLVVEFFCVFVVVRLMRKKDIYVEFRNEVLRSVIFTVEGVVKARGIIESLHIVTGLDNAQITQSMFIEGLFICCLQGSVPGIIYLFDSFFCVDIPLRMISVSGILRLGKIGLVASGSGMIVEILVSSIFSRYFVNVSLSSMVVYAIFLYVYCNDTIKYSKNFKHHRE